MGKPAARMTDATLKGGPIVQGSATVLIGDAGGKACSVCPGGMAVGSPVNPALGAKVLMGPEELDFALPGPLPVVWQRQYSSYVNEAHGAPCGLLGYGWKLPAELSLQLQTGRILLWDASGRVVTFEEELAPGGQLYSASEDLWLMRGGGLPGISSTQAPATATYLPWTQATRFAHVPAAWKRNPHCVLATSGDERTIWVFEPTAADANRYRLVHVLDAFGRSQTLSYCEADTRHPHEAPGRLRSITDGVGRRFVLRYGAIKHPTDAPHKQLGADSGWRLLSVVCEHLNRNAQGQPQALVTYRYDAAGNLVEVLARDGSTARQFAYDSAHRMVAHRVRQGPLHRYVYEDQDPQSEDVRKGRPLLPPQPGARVVEQHNEEGLSYRFTYIDPPEPVRIPAPSTTQNLAESPSSDAQDITPTEATPAHSQVHVQDSLGRRMSYHFAGRGGDKRLAAQTHADGSTERHEYDGAGRKVASTDALGRTTRWRYDGQGRLLGVQHVDGRTSQQSWGEAGTAQAGLLLQSTTPSGVHTHYRYDAVQRLTHIVVAPGTAHEQATQLHYEAPQADGSFAPEVRAWCDQVVALTDAQGGHKRFGYSPTGQLQSATDCSGHSSYWQYDAWGDLIETRDALGQRLRHQRDPLGRVQVTQQADGSILRYHWDANGHMTRLDLGVAPEAAASHTPASASPPLTSIHYTHDLWGRICKQSQAGQGVQLHYDLAGRVQTLVNENAARTQFTYDSRDRLVQEIGFDGRGQTYRYDAAGQLIEQRDFSTQIMYGLEPTVTSRYHHDKAGQLIARVVGTHYPPGSQTPHPKPAPLPLLEVQTFAYDTSGQLAEAQSWTLHEPTSDERQEATPDVTSDTNQTSPIQAWLQLNTAELQSALNPSCNNPQLAALRQTLQANSCVKFQRDPLGRLLGETQTLYLQAPAATGDQSAKAEEAATEFEHRITHRLGALGQRHSSQLSGLGQLDWQSYGPGHVHGVLLDQTPLLSLERDALHREHSRTLHVLNDSLFNPNTAPKHLQQTRTLDPLGRLLHQSWQGLHLPSPHAALAAQTPLIGGMASGQPKPTLQHPLDQLRDRRYQYDPLGQLTAIHTQADQTTYHYDPRQRLTGLQRTPIGSSVQAALAPQTQTWQLDPAGNRLAKGFEATLKTQTERQQRWAQQVKINIFDPDFDLLKPDPEDGDEGPSHCYPRNRIFHRTQGTETQRLRYDTWGNRTHIEYQTGQDRLHYNPLHQLTHLQRCDAQGKVQTQARYRYDPLGRRLSKTIQGANNPAQTIYYGWDGERQVHQEDAEQLQHTVYEPHSFVPLLQLQRRKAPTSTLQTLWAMTQAEEENEHKDDQAQAEETQNPFASNSASRELIEDTLSSVLDPHTAPAILKTLKSAMPEALFQQLTEGLETLQAAKAQTAKANPITIRHYLCDHLGTPLALVDATGANAGQVTWAARYGAWGEIEEEYNPDQIDQPIRFQGQQWDEESGLHYNRYRYYDPATGGYVSQDPIGLQGGINSYMYAKSSAQNYIDPIGLWAVLALPQFWIGVLGILGVGVAVNSQRNQPDISSSTFPSIGSSPPSTSQPTAAQLTAAHLAAAGNRAAAGYGGNCTPDRHDELSEKQKDACDSAKGLTCSFGEISFSKADAISKCIDARVKIARECFEGGDAGHNKQINQLKAIVGKCTGHKW